MARHCTILSVLQLYRNTLTPFNPINTFHSCIYNQYLLGNRQPPANHSVCVANMSSYGTTSSFFTDERVCTVWSKNYEYAAGEHRQLIRRNLARIPTNRELKGLHPHFRPAQEFTQSFLFVLALGHQLPRAVSARPDSLAPP